MGRKIRALKTFAFILISIEIVLISLFCIFYFNNLFELQAKFKVEYIALSGVVSLASLVFRSVDYFLSPFTSYKLFQLLITHTDCKHFVAGFMYFSRQFSTCYINSVVFIC